MGTRLIAEVLCQPGFVFDEIKLASMSEKESISKADFKRMSDSQVPLLLHDCYVVAMTPVLWWR